MGITSSSSNQKRGRSKQEYLRQVRKLGMRHPERSLKQISERPGRGGSSFIPTSMCSSRQWGSLKAAASSAIRATKSISSPEKALAHATRKAMNEALARDHPDIFAQIEPTVWQKPWVAQAQGAGRGRTALRYLAAYVKKSAFSEGRLMGYDQTGRRIVLSYRDSADGKLKSEALDPFELIRRWLLHVLPKGLVRLRHYGWLSAAAHKAFLRVRFLLGLGPYRIPPAIKSEPPRCPFCNALLAQIARIAPQRGPPLCQAILKAAV